jgi:hypothetical protein
MSFNMTSRTLAMRRPLLRQSMAAISITCLICFMGSGCSRQVEDKWSKRRPPSFPTTGSVTWNGEPAAGALVTLQSLSHNVAASGRANDKGEFALTTWRQGDGAVVGDHNVTIETIVVAGYGAGGSVIEVNAMPPKYEKPDTSGLTATINDKGKNVLSFAVEGPRRGPTGPVPVPSSFPSDAPPTK